MSAEVVGYALGISLVGLIGVPMFTFRVRTGERAIVINRVNGAIEDKVYSEGIYMSLPFVRKVAKYNVRPRPHMMNDIVYTHDKEKVRIDVRVLTHPMEHRLPTIHRNYGKNYFELVLRSGIHKALGDVVVEYVTDQLIRKREEIRKGIYEHLTARFSHYSIVVDDVFITNMAIGKEEIAETEAKELIVQVEAKLERKINFLSTEVRVVDSGLRYLSSNVHNVESRLNRLIDNVQKLNGQMLDLANKSKSTSISK